ncbi:MAG: SDR family oxidoreductase [Pseudomonadota bacterium]|nr:SDR family oxidoreductase [Pseudomonadota bacterium]
MDLGLKDARVIITGGASHIGRAIVLGLAAEGAAIAIIDRDVAQAERTAEAARAGGAAAAHVVGADLTDHGAADAATGQAMDLLGGVDVLLTNVGSNRPAFFLDTPPESWDHLLHLNLSSCMSCVRAVLPAMQAQGHGAIVATASTAAFGEPRQGVYAAAKAGVVAFIRTIAQEYGRYGIRANLVAPGLVLPEGDAEAMGELSLWHDRDAVMNDDQVTYVKRNTPLRRLSRTGDIARSVIFLASDVAARQLTGQMLTVSGGFAMR